MERLFTESGPLAPVDGRAAPGAVGQTGRMLSFVLWLVVALVLLLAVFLVANVMSRTDEVPGDAPQGSGIGGFWTSFRAGLRHRGRGREHPVDTDLQAFFAASVEEGPAYVDAEHLSDVLVRAREQAVRPLHVGTVRAPR